MKNFILLLLVCLSPLASAKEAKMSKSPKAWENFKKPAAAELKKQLSPLQFEVTQEEGTERAFSNEYWDNHEDGIYVDRVSGEPLFSSLDKYDSGTGWPSFSKPLAPSQIVTKKDRRLLFSRTEVRSKLADSHLGHVFDDGPKPTGLRYCMNSAALRFIPVAQLEAEGYDEFKILFSKGEPSVKPGAVDTGKTQLEVATLAGGCFWGMEELLRKMPGIVSTVVGYTGGTLANPNYELVKTGATGHAESIEIKFDPKKTSYEEILRFFFRIHDPTTKNRQGNDVGTQYRSAIFVHDETQRKVAEKVKGEVDASGKWPKPILTEIVKAGPFYSAEEYHQDYLQKNPGGYTCHFIRD